MVTPLSFSVLLSSSIPFNYPLLHLSLDFQSFRLIPATSGNDVEQLNKNCEIVHFIENHCWLLSNFFIQKYLWSTFGVSSCCKCMNTTVKKKKTKTKMFALIKLKSWISEFIIPHYMSNTNYTDG